MLGTLHELKTWLLNPDLVKRTDYDNAIAQLGLGVAAQFETACNRKFARAQRNRIIGGYLCNLVLDTYPVEGKPVIEVTDEPPHWEPAQDTLEKFHPHSGIVWLKPTDAELRRIIWTGGYFIDYTDEKTTPLPETATPLPEDLRLAWLQQCEHIWTKHQKLGVPINTTLSTAEVTQTFLPSVETTLRAYRRLNL